MAVDIRTLALILGATQLVQVLVFFHQFRVNKAYPGIGWWLAWSCAELIGFSVMMFRNQIPGLNVIILVQNTAIFSGTVFLYIGVVRFLKKPIRFSLVIPAFILFFLGLIVFLFIHEDYRIRSAIVYSSLSFIAILTAYDIRTDTSRKDIASSANFTAIIFTVHGCFLAGYTGYILLMGRPLDDFFSPSPSNYLPKLIYLFVTMLWTYGLIILLNQKASFDLSESQKDLKLIFDTSPDSIIITNIEDGMIRDFNEGYCRITGYSRDEIKGKSSVEMNIWKDIEDRRRIIDLLNKSGVCENFEAQFITKGGHEITGLLSARFINFDGIRHILSIVRDISERKSFEQSIIESELKYRSLIDNSPDATLINQENKISFVNKACIQLFGAEKVEELIGRTLLEFVNQSSYDTLSTRIRSPFECAQQDPPVEVLLERMDGSSVPVEVIVAPFIMKGVDVIHVIIRDISLRKKAEEENRRFNESLEQKVMERTLELTHAYKEMESFSYSISHDLRSPLRAINGFTTFLQEDYADKLDDEAKRYCKIISENAVKMGQLIDDLLAFSKLGRSDLDSTVIDMNMMVNNIIEELQDKQAPLRIHWSIESLVPISGDYTLIHQVWYNLISNAIKFSSRREKIEISIRCERENGRVVYSIKDNGVGFDETYRHKLFKVFQRLHTPEEFEGTGIGLAIVDRIVKKHGGEVWAKSDLNVGSTFFFSLPG